MITPMVKYTFLLLKSDQERFLAKLGEIGVVDVTVSDWRPDEEQQRLIGTMSAYDAVLAKLKNVHAAAEKDEDFLAAAPYDTAEEAVRASGDCSSRIDKISADISKAVKERDELAVWGGFDPAMLDKLAAEGVELRFFVSSAKQFDPEWEREYPIVRMDGDDGNVRFVAVSHGEELAFDGAVEMRRPESSVHDKEARIKSLESELADARMGLARAVASMKLIESAREDVRAELSHSKVVSTVGEAVDGSVSVVEGWVPEPRRTEVDEAFADEGVVVFTAAPTIEDNPPILLKNNRFARLCEMISNLYDMPGYRELDLTPFFAPFFILFVGICFGDLGYGIVTFLCALGAYIAMRKNDFARSVSALVMWCSFAAVIMGSVTGTFFGMELKSFEPLKNLPFLGQMDMFTFAIVVGLVQIIYAMFVQVYARTKYMGFRYAISTLGWALTVLVSALAYVLSSAGVPFGFDSPIYIALVSVFMIANIFFSSPGKSIFANFGSGLWGLYNNVTGLLGDVLSYIRLFALGLSSGIIAGVFNDLAVSMSGDVPVLKYVIMVIILLLGHTINLFMSAISSFVHPLRLTFVEFYKNAGFEGGGRAYDPYRVKRK